MKICSVPYYNTLPLTWFLNSVFQDMVLTTDYPARLADGLCENRYDLAMMPIGAFCKLKNATIVGDACIGCHGAVASVLMFSRKPLEEMKSLSLDNDSRTSVALGQILLHEFYGNHHFRTTPFARTDDLGEVATDAFLVIGDRALICRPDREKWPFRFDLGELWLEKTGLPFVFAAWIATRPDIAHNDEIVSKLQKARDLGQENFETIVREVTAGRKFQNTVFPYPVSEENLLWYYRENMVYTMTDEHRKAIGLYFQLGRKYDLFQ